MQPSTRRGQQTRQKLLEAAEAIFGEKGYERASVVAITQRAGVAQGTFYVYFPDKKAAFVELVKALNRRLRRELATAVDGLDDRIEVECVGFRTFFNFVQKHTNLYKIVRQAEFVDPALFQWYYRSLAESYAQGLAQAMEKGQIPAYDPESLAYCLMGIGDFLGMRWVLWGGQSPPDQIFEDVMAFIRHGLLHS
jgi:AcrR family transcriptional regulator